MSAERFRPSVTVAAIVEQRGRFLLVEGLRLNNPAGHLDEGETLLEAVVREALEETARVFRPEALLGVYMSRFRRPARGEDVTYVRFAVCGSVGEPEAGRALDAGIVRTLWLTPGEVRASRDRHRSPLVLRCVEDHLAGVRHPLSALVADASIAAPEIKGRAP